MLVRLLPDQVTEHWEIVKRVLVEGTPYGEDQPFDEYLKGFLRESMHCWVEVEENKILATVITTSTLGANQENILLVFALVAFEKLPDSSWTNGLETLKRFAKAHGYSRIVGETDSRSVVEHIQAVGGHVKSFVSIPV